jgi:hypothetical protein
MSNSTGRCSAHLQLPTYWWKRNAASFKLILLSFILITGTIAKSQTIHWSQSSNKNNTQGTVVWIGSIVQSSNSTYYEGQSTLQRLFLVDIPTDPSGHYKLTFKHLATKGSINAYDFVTGWYNSGSPLNGKAITTSNAIDPNCYVNINNCSETGQNNDPIFLICGTLDAAPLNYSNAVPSSSYAGPGGAPAISSNGNVKGRVEDWDANFSPTGSNGRRITIQSNATISNVNLAMIGYDAGNDQYAQYELSWTGPTAPGFFSILVKIGGHIADQQFYGVGKGASNIDGGPYHFKVSNLFLGDAPYDSQHTISLGDRDNQLKGADILIPPPPCTIAPQTQSVCQGGTSQQYCGPAGMAVYAWSISPAGATLSATNTQCVTVTSNTPGTYTLTLVTTNNGVQSTATCNATFIVNALPTVTANDASVCTGSSVQLTASPAGGTWSGANVSASGLFNAAGLAAGPYVVTYTYTNANNCTNSDPATVTVNALPTVTANDASVCTGSSVQLTASPAGGTWSGANVSASGLFNAAGLAAGPYVVTYTYTNANNCTNSDPATVTVNALPTVTANDASVCTGSSVQLTASPAGGTWSGANVSASGLFNAAGLAAGPYVVTYTYTNANNCTNSDPATVTVNALPTVTANDASVCTGSSVQLTASPAGGTWSGANVSASGLFNAAGLSAGPYVVTYTYTNANNCTNSDPATVTVNALPTVTANDASVCVGQGTVQLTASPAGGTWSGANVSASGLFNAAGLAAGPYVVTYTYTNANNCTNSDPATVTVNPNPVISCSATPVLIDITSAAHNSQLNVDLSANADANPANYTYAWTEDGAGSFNFSNIKNPVYTAAVLDAGQTVSFTVTVTHIATGCSTVSQCSLTVNTAGSCPEVTTSSICGGTTTSYSANRGPSANETWVWSVNNGASINAPNGQQTVSVTAGNQSFTLTLTISYANTALSPTQCTYEVTVTSCAGNCTYTQGKYGNTSPACDADGSNGTAFVYPTVLDMIKAMLGVNGVANPLVIGSNGKFVTIPPTASGATLLHASMPGGSTPRELFASCTVDNVPVLPACWTPGTNTLSTYITKQGKINNVLLSQTIALGLNMRVSGGLPGFILQAGTFATAARDGDCGSNVAKVRTCVYNPILLQWVVTNEYTFKTITQSVIDALNCKQYPLNVSGLYQLANDALGNVDGTIGTECNASLSDINNAVAAINEGFDNCRIFIGWNETPCGVTTGRIDITASGMINNNVITASRLSVSAYPNPFRDNVNFVIASPESGKAVLEVYNLFGQKLQTVYEGFIYAGRSQDH